ncbi:uncharacterized protein LOC143878978 [Tasmannia lanceolata]|uniref:uncharacterized protein LOC143878978 n=1 Tax=Tasmannia lanceolata TaxID=3420 RepID=UPI0040647E57
MPFGLKNAVATYQRLVNKILAIQIGRNMEVYVDDMLVKSLEARNEIFDLEEASVVLRQNRMKLNPLKYTFGVTSGKFLGFMLKAYLQTLPLLSKLVPGEDLYLYLAVGPAPKLDTSGPLINSAIELGEFDIQVKPRPAIKSQVLEDFVTECTMPVEGHEDQDVSTEKPAPQPPASGHPWMLYVDGSANAGGSGAGLVISELDNLLVEYALKLDFKASNNEAEYEALITGIALATELHANRLRAHSDSQLIVGQVNGLYEAKETRMLKYLEKVRSEISTFTEFQIVQIPRTMNARADALSKMASSGIIEPGNIYIKILPQPRIEKEEVLQIMEEPTLMDLILQYLRVDSLSQDRKEAWRLVARSAHYVLDKQTLYKHSFAWPLLKCLRSTAADLAMREVHEGICGDHSGGKVLAHKILR